MFFLIRCAFWLWVVFSTIFAQTSADGAAPRQQAPPRSTAAVKPVTNMAQLWLEAAASRVADRCAASPATCLAVAAQLSKLATEQDPSPRASVSVAHTPPMPAGPQHEAGVPLPPRRPKFEAAAWLMRPRLEKTARGEYLKGQTSAGADF